ncbi:MAG TPA: glycosyltransferase [Armatimonadota bacterium]
MLVDRSGDPAVSVVIPSYNSKSTIVQVLKALTVQSTDLPYEIILVESSGDGTCEIVREQFPDVQVIESREKLLPGGARNLGTQQARGGLLYFIDADCEAEPDWISKMWKTHEEWDCAAVAGAIMNANPSSLASVSSYMNEFSDFFAYGPARYKDYLPSGNISYKASIFRKYGGFDPDAPMYQDLMFNKLLSRSGEKLLFNPRIRVAHNHRTDLKVYLGHEVARGKGGAECRRLGLIIGSSWVKHPPLAFLAAPGLFLRKASVFPFRFARAYPTEIPRMLRALPVFFLALIVWHYGFLSDVVANRPKSKSAE